MSGIAGVYYLDGRPVGQTDLGKLTNSLAHRGPDDVGMWSKGSVGLGHRMLWTTPESLHEKLPLTSQMADLAITADARIDNRAELLPLLGFSGRPAAEVTDSQLILAAYEKWEERCPEKLLGDFAFAIWDGRRQRLFCARDHFGIRPFYYYQSDRIFIFSSEIKTLFCLPEVPQRLNELMVGYHFAATVGENAVTFYQDILRLPPRHSLTISCNETRLQTYWMPDPSRELRLNSDEEYAEAFLEVFSEAVSCRLRSAFPIGSELSGGLDSSSVTCMARELMTQTGQHPLHTFSAVYDNTPDSDERDFINTVLAQGGLESHYVYMDNISPLADTERVFWLVDETFTSPTVYIPWEMCRKAQEQGVRVLLSGLDGDTTVSHGWEHLINLARAAKWADFAREAKAIDQHPNLPSRHLLLEDYAFPYLIESARQGRWISFAQGVNGLSEHFNIPQRYLVRNYGLKPLTPAPIRRAWRALRGRNHPVQNDAQFINPDFARRITLAERLAALSDQELSLPQTARDKQCQALTSDVMPYMFEWSNRTAVAFSIEGRHPFADIRLVELCLALPPEQKLHQGWTRMIMRRAMTNILPKKIQWRGGKTVNSTAFIHTFLHFAGRQMEEVIVKEPGSLKEYININLLRQAYDRCLAQQATDADILKVWQAVTLALWLRHVHLTP